MPDTVGRRPSSASGFLGTTNTSRFHGPLCMQKRLRLFLLLDMITSNQTFSNDNSGISIGIPPHLALWAVHQRGTSGVSFRWFACIIASNEGTTTSTLSTSISRTHTTCHDSLVPRLVLAVLEDLSPEPVRAFLIAPSAVFPLLWLEVP